MKTLLIPSVICLFILIGCKKTAQQKIAQQRTITVTTTNISTSTIYTVVVHNTTTAETPLDISTVTGVGNQTFSFIANSGDVLNAQYAFYTTGKVNGQGNLDFVCNGQNLLHADGGNGTNFIIKVP